MLTLYKPSSSKSKASSSSSSSSEDEKLTIPAGRPYLTKVNGKLMLARHKKEKPAESVALGLLGEAFGGRTRIIRRRTKSLERPPTPLLIGGVPYVPQPHQQQLVYTVPPQQQALPSALVAIQPYPQIQQQQQQQPAGPQIPSQQPQRYNVNARPPTKEELDELKFIGADFVQGDKRDKPASETKKADEEMASRTSITVTRHICANCGRVRSKKYHHENPIKPGEEPRPGFCRKCQKDASSTSGSISDRGPRPSSDHGARKEKGGKDKKKNKSKKKKKKSKKKHKKRVESSSDSESTVTLESRFHPKPILKKRSVKYVPAEDYIIVDEEQSEESEPRGRRRRSHRSHQATVIEEYRYRRPHSPTTRQHITARSQSAGRAERYEIPNYIPRQRVSRVQSPEYRYVDIPTVTERVETVEDPYPRKIAIQFLDDDNKRVPSINSRSVLADDDESSRQYHRNELPEYDHPIQYSERVEEPFYGTRRSSRRTSRESLRSVDRHTQSKESTFRDRDYSDVLSRYPRDDIQYVERRPSIKVYNSSIRDTREAPRSENVPSIGRRSVSRSNSFEFQENLTSQSAREPGPELVRPPYGIRRSSEESYHNHQRPMDGKVVTRRLQYRPKELPVLDESERRLQDRIDKQMLNTSTRRHQFSAREDAARYYQNDWHEENSIREGSSASRAEGRRSGYRRDGIEDSELAASEISYRYVQPIHDDPPRASTPPSPALTITHSQRESGTPYPRRVNVEGIESYLSSKKAGQRGGSPPLTERPRRNASIPRPAYVREATDGGTEKTVFPSPARSYERESPRDEFIVEDYELSLASGLTEMEREAEERVRRVAFRDDLSQRSGGGLGYTTTESGFAENQGGWYVDSAASGW